MSEDNRHPHSEIGRRLISVRVAFTSDSVRAFAKRMDVSAMTVSGWETGSRRVPVESAELYCDMFGLTLDWIYRGRRDGLSETASKMV